MAYLTLENSDTPVLVEDRDLPYLAGRRWFLRDGDVVGEGGVRAIDLILEERGGRLRTLDPHDLRRQNLMIDRGVSYVAARGLWRAGVRYGETAFLALAQVKHKEKAQDAYVQTSPDLRRLLAGKALHVKPTNIEDVVFDPASGFFALLQDGRVVKAARKIVTLKK